MKNKIQKGVISIMLVLMMIVGTFAAMPITVNAAEGEYKVGYSDLVKVIIDGKEEHVTRFTLTDDGGNVIYAYCVNMDLPCFSSSTYKLVSASDYFKNGEDKQIMAALTYIAYNYGSMETTNPNGYSQLIQCVIWRIIHGYDVSYIENVDGAIIRDVVNHIYDNIDDITKDYQTSVTLQGIGDVFRQEADYTYYGPFSVSENTILANVDFTLAFTQGGASAAFVTENGTPITKVKPGEQIYVRIPGGVSGDFKFDATASATQELKYVYDFQFFIDVRDFGNGELVYQPLFQPLFQPLMGFNIRTNFYSCSSGFTIKSVIEKWSGCETAWGGWATNDADFKTFTGNTNKGDDPTAIRKDGVVRSGKSAWSMGIEFTPGMADKTVDLIMVNTQK